MPNYDFRQKGATMHPGTDHPAYGIYDAMEEGAPFGYAPGAPDAQTRAAYEGWRQRMIEKFGEVLFELFGDMHDPSPNEQNMYYPPNRDLAERDYSMMYNRGVNRMLQYGPEGRDSTLEEMDGEGEWGERGGVEEYNEMIEHTVKDFIDDLMDILLEARPGTILRERERDAQYRTKSRPPGRRHQRDKERDGRTR